VTMVGVACLAWSAGMAAAAAGRLPVTTAGVWRPCRLGRRVWLQHHAVVGYHTQLGWPCRQGWRGSDGLRVGCS
jgi:hypothetical protein